MGSGTKGWGFASLSVRLWEGHRLPEWTYSLVVKVYCRMMCILNRVIRGSEYSVAASNRSERSRYLLVVVVRV